MCNRFCFVCFGMGLQCFDYWFDFGLLRAGFAVLSFGVFMMCVGLVPVCVWLGLAPARFRSVLGWFRVWFLVRFWSEFGFVVLWFRLVIGWVSVSLFGFWFSFGLVCLFGVVWFGFGFGSVCFGLEAVWFRFVWVRFGSCLVWVRFRFWVALASDCFS